MPQEAEASVLTIDTFEQMVALAAERRDLQIKAALERDVRLVRCEDGTLEIALEPGAPRTLVNDLSRKLQQWTGRRWMVIVSGEQGAATLRSQADARQAELEVGVRADPLVRAVLTRFPGAEIVGVRGQSETMPDVPAFVAQGGVPPADDDGGFGDNWVRDDGND
jgi:DNA polymerase-3 subunit gamma/tau